MSVRFTKELIMRLSKYILTILLTFSMITASSYIEKGTWNISGSIYFTDNITNNDFYEKYFYIKAGTYHFVHKSISIGSDVSYTRIWDGDDITRYYTINPGIRLYLLTGEKIFPFIKTSGEYYLVKYNDGSSYDITGYFYGCGTDIFLRKNVALEPYCNYHIIRRRENNDLFNKIRRLELGISLSIFFP